MYSSSEKSQPAVERLGDGFLITHLAPSCGPLTMELTPPRSDTTKPPKPHLVLENICQQKRVDVAGDAVDGVVGSHHRLRAALNDTGLGSDGSQYS